MKYIFLTIVLTSYVGCASQRTSADEISEGEWWMLSGSERVCVANKDEYYWLSPDTLVSDYECHVNSEINVGTAVECTSGELKGNSYYFSRNQEMCELFAKFLNNDE